MELSRYIQHPENLNRETLYELRSYVALYPYHQAARLLMLQNLYLLHDPTFDEELRTAAFYMADRTVLFNLVEAKHYQLNQNEKKTEETVGDRTDVLITQFLDSLPEEKDEEQQPKRKPTAADATVDYVAYLMDTAAMEEEQKTDKSEDNHASTLIDNFLSNEGGKITLSDEDGYTPHNRVELENDKDELEEEYYTETLAKICIKQGNYSKALEIIQRLNLLFPKKSAYFADQMRYLEKIILINK